MKPVSPTPRLAGTSVPWRHGPNWPGIEIRVTTRFGGVSLPPYDSLNLAEHVGDQPQAVAENRRRLRQALPGEPLWLQQVHGVQVCDAETVLAGQAGLSVPQADAAITSTTERVLAIMTADCLPIVIYSTQPRVIVLLHAGWRGLAGGILEASLAALQRAADDITGATGQWDPGQCRAWIGPGIGPEAFEVGDEVRAAMGSAAYSAFTPRQDRPQKWWCDLPAVARQRLSALDVGHIVNSGWCTFHDEQWYSYRRDGRTGRFATLAWLTAGQG